MTARKKDFSNPAMQFISGVDKVVAEDPAPAAAKASPQAVPPAEDQQQPAGQQAQKYGIFDKDPAGYRVQYVETKTKRLQLVLQPSLYKKLKENAKKSGLSVNEYVHRVLRAAMGMED